MKSASTPRPRLPPSSPRLLVLVLCAGLSGCSPVYVMKSAAGHAKFLLRRQSIEKAVKDPRTAAPLREKLQLVLDARRFAVEELKLAPSADYTTFSKVDGPVTFIVSGSSKTSLTPYEWWFPFVGRVPYKGYFHRADALKEKARLEAAGWDAYMRGVSAYNTPLWISDPLPSSVLDQPPGGVAELILHELTHGTVSFKDQTDFNESAATFVGQEGALAFLARRFGAGSQSLADYRQSLASDRAFDAVMQALRTRLEEVYRSSATTSGKLTEREAVFHEWQARFAAFGVKLPELNNAVVLAHGAYHTDLAAFAELHARVHGDWAKTVAVLRGLDRKAPASALRAYLSAQ